MPTSVYITKMDLNEVSKMDPNEVSNMNLNECISKMDTNEVSYMDLYEVSKMDLNECVKDLDDSMQQLASYEKIKVLLCSTHQSQENLKKKIGNFQTKSSNLEKKLEHCIVDDGSLVLYIAELLSSFDDVIKAEKTAREDCAAVHGFAPELSRGKSAAEKEICQAIMNIADDQIQYEDLVLKTHEDIVQVCWIPDLVIWNIILIASRGLYLSLRRREITELELIRSLFMALNAFGGKF